MTVLLGQRLRLHRGSRAVIAGVDLEVKSGEFVLLAGRNGAGKTTLLRLMLGAERAEDGGVYLDDKLISLWDPLARAREIAFVPQSAECPFEFTGRELVAMGRYPHRPGNEPLGARDLAAIDRALRAVDADEFADRPVTTLSGGEQRRIAVARALATEASLLLLDEPTSNLDLEHALQLVDLLKREAAGGRGILVASHDINLLARHCDRVALLHDGKVVVTDVPEQALSRRRVKKVFGVEAVEPDGYFPREFRLNS